MKANANQTLLPKCLCGGVGGEQQEHNGIPIFVCSRCGIVRQHLNMTEQELDVFYEKQYHDHFGDKEYKHDRSVAALRLKQYKLKQETRLLDLGSGNGAFVDAARGQGIEAYGCEVSANVSRTKYFYNEPLCDIHFPTDYFDTITIHDVLEHMVNPVAILEECFRILKQEGTLILDYPLFFSKAGKHHWKPIEHLWFLNRQQIQDVLQAAGYVYNTCKAPIPSKIVFYVSKPVVARPRIMTAPGIGDTYWALVKLQSFLKQQKLGLPDIYVSSPTQYKKDHSLEFVRRCPFVNAAGYHKHDETVINREGYVENGRTIFKDELKMDYFIAYNGVMRFGRSIDEVDPTIKTNWEYDMFQPFEEREVAKKMRAEYGDYTVAYFIPHGPYVRWLAEFSIENIYKVLLQMYHKYGHKVILIGADWDANTLEKKLLRLDKAKILVNMVGKTNLDEAFGIIRGSKGVFGYPSGITIMATVFRKPTLMLWNDYYHPLFPENVCPPGALNKWYKYIDTKDASADTCFDTYEELVFGREHYEPTSRPQAALNPAPKERPKKQKEKRKPPERTYSKKLPKPAIVCVLKTGGDFTEDCVNRLGVMLKKTFNAAYEFVCVTNSKKKIKCDRKIEMKHDWPGMWSKIEIFRPGLFKGNVLYLDLDMVVLDDLSGFVRELNGSFHCLHGWNDRRKDKLCSAMMAWSKDMSKIYEALVLKEDQIFTKTTIPWWLEQDHIETTLQEEMAMPMAFIQDEINVVSFKHHCTVNGTTTNPPEGTDVVCFHGKPRPIEVKNCKWIEEAWK